MTLDDDFSAALHDVCSAWPALVPPSGLSVSQGAASTLVIKRPGGASGYWSAEETPYMVEPMDLLGSRAVRSVCFVGPAQSGKTVGLGEGWLAHAVRHDPGDMLLVQMTQDKAREYSKQRVDRAIRNSPELKALRTASSRDDNLHDKQFRNGMWVRLAWPTATNLASSSYRYVFGTDYDRWPDDIDGEGDGFTLMGKRTTTFLSRGKTAVESSPGRPLKDPYWRPSTPHEAPPVTGILGIYNIGDRRRQYWCCVHCREWFQATPGLGLFGLPPDDELLRDIRKINIEQFARQHARVICPTCGAFISFQHRAELNRAGRWLAEGLTLDSQGRLSGTPRRSLTASFWLGGVAAAYVTWQALVQKHLDALLDYALTGKEKLLQTTANTDQCVPYLSMALRDAKARVAPPRERTDPEAERYVVPQWTRFLLAAVDVQGGQNARFECQVHAVGVDGEQQVVDRFRITHSKRKGFGEDFAAIDPASYAEDWDVLTDRLVNATYRTADEDRELRIKMILCDSGGEAGVTDKAYSWWRRLRRIGEHRRVRLTKGANTRVDWFVRETWVGGDKDREGDVALYLFDPNKFKDAVFAGVRRTEPGPGYYHFPSWLPAAFFDELEAEVRRPDGTYEQVKRANETLDLCTLIRVGIHMLGVDRREFWKEPPAWAAPLERNSEVVTRQDRWEMQKAATTQTWGRRARRSAYMG